MTIAEQLATIEAEKQAQKQIFLDNGIDMDGVPFVEYHDKILEIVGGEFFVYLPSKKCYEVVDNTSFYSGSSLPRGLCASTQMGDLVITPSEGQAGYYYPSTRIINLKTGIVKAGPDNPSGARAYMTAANDGQYEYNSVGFPNGSGNATSTFRYFNPETESWVGNISLPVAKCYNPLAYYEKEGKRYIYSFGGSPNRGSTLTDDIYRLDVDAQTWKKLNVVMPIPFISVNNPVIHKGKAYLCSSTNMYIYNLDNDSVTVGPSAPVTVDYAAIFKHKDFFTCVYGYQTNLVSTFIYESQKWIVENMEGILHRRFAAYGQIGNELFIMRGLNENNVPQNTSVKIIFNKLKPLVYLKKGNSIYADGKLHSNLGNIIEAETIHIASDDEIIYQDEDINFGWVRR